jgi:hypothetical protein
MVAMLREMIGPREELIEANAPVQEMRLVCGNHQIRPAIARRPSLQHASVAQPPEGELPELFHEPVSGPQEVQRTEPVSPGALV